MEVWFVFLISLCASILLKALFDLLAKTQKQMHKLPPGPPSLPFIGNFLWFQRSLSDDFESSVRSLHAKYGPLISFRLFSSRYFIFISSHCLAHRTLIHHAAAFADRPPPGIIIKHVSSNQHSITSANYGPNWRLFRRNLASQLFHPSLIASLSPLRTRVLQILINRIDGEQSRSENFVTPVEHFRYAMFCLLVFMCFGDEDAIDEDKINRIMAVQVQLIKSLNRFRVLSFWPRMGKIVFRNRWREFMAIINDRVDELNPLIRGRIKTKQIDDCDDNEQKRYLCYADTLIDLELPEEGKRRLTEEEMVSLCSEFLTGGTDTTTTALQWIMANLVKSPQIQQKLFAEIRNVKMGSSSEEAVVKEEDLPKMPFLKAVILEGLRRHPPGHFVVPHAVHEEIELGGYVIPKDSIVNFMVADMGRDPQVWEEPMEFRPERFIEEGADGGGFDMTGTREVKMMPFGVGRRICPGMGVAMLHLEYFVANLVWRFEWKGVDGEESVDLSEKNEFTVVMKKPLRVRLSPRLPLAC